MSDDKKYYYLKLKDNFFDSDEIIVIESMADGYLYCNILLKLYLRSLKNEGKLMFNDRIPYNSTILAQITRQPVGVIEKALNIFQQFGLMEILDNGAIYMLDIQNYIGQSSSEADRKRIYRKGIDDEKQELLSDGQMSDKCPDKSLDKPQDISPPEREIEREKEVIPYKDIIDYLNLKTNKKYKSTSTKTKEIISTRWNESFTLEDFIKVIDIKSIEWLSTDMEKFLRPETLFSNKFEGYLNQPMKKVIVEKIKTKAPTRREDM